MKAPITTHVLDLGRGCPAAGIAVILEKQEKEEWNELGRGRTDEDGRISDLLPAGSQAEAGLYRLTFESAAYFRGLGTDAFHPFIQVPFEVREPSGHYHVPLLLSAFGYSTYRGS